MQRRFCQILISIVVIFSGLHFAHADTFPNNFFPWVEVERSTNREIIANITIPTDSQMKDIVGGDGITYKQFNYDDYNFVSYNQEGKPQIPVRYINFQVPDDAANFSVEVIQDFSEERPNSRAGSHNGPGGGAGANNHPGLPEGIDVYPAPKVYFETNSEGIPIEKCSFSKDNDFYAKDTWYPNKFPVFITGTSFIRQLRMLTVAMTPILVNPVKRNIKEFYSFKLRISYASGLQENKIAIDSDSRHHTLFRSLVPNYDYAPLSINHNSLDETHVLAPQDLINPNPGFTIDYLVVCANQFFNPISPSLQALFDWRDSPQGGNHNIGVASVADIYAQYPAETHQQSIKNFTQFVFDNWRIDPQDADLSFVLLVGDADYENDTAAWFVPTWRSVPGDEWPPFYYGDAGDNDYVCLNGADEVPDVAIGRFAVKTETELAAVASKPVSFEQNPPQGVNHYGTRNLYLTASFNQNNPARELLLSHYSESQEWYNDGESPFNYDSDRVTNFLDTQGALTVTYCGHGGFTNWSHPVMVENLNNGGQLPALVLSLACLTGCFDEPYEFDCYGEVWTKRPNAGAVCFLGSSRVTTTNSFWYQPAVLGYIYSDTPNYIVGSLVQALKADAIVPVEDKRRFILFGDPAVNIAGHIDESQKPEFIPSMSVSNPQPSPGEEITLFLHVQNRGLSGVQDLPVQLFYRDDDGNQIPIGNEHLITVGGDNDTVTIEQPWMYSNERFTHFVFVPNVQEGVDELCEYNNHLLGDAIYNWAPIWVDDDNNGPEDGSFEHPFNTIEEAVDFVRNHRGTGNEMITIRVREGNYTVLSPRLLIVPSWTYIFGYGNLEDIAVNATVRMMSDSARFGNLTINYANGLPSNYNAIYRGLVIGNIFRGWDIAAKTRVAFFANNIFYDNQTAVQSLSSGSQLTFINNTMVDNGMSFDMQNLIGLTLRNNIIWNNGLANISGTNLNVEYNDSNDETLIGLGEHNINANPLFYDDYNHNFHLSPLSPAINAGDPTPGYNDIDGSRNDMGAYGSLSSLQNIAILSPSENEIVQTLRPTISWVSCRMADDENLELVISRQRIYPLWEPVLTVTIPNTGTYTVPTGILEFNAYYRVTLSRTSGSGRTKYGASFRTRFDIGDPDDVRQEQRRGP